MVHGSRSALPGKRRVRYKLEAGKHCIDVRIRNPRQLFDARDPAPFRERDLDDEFVEYVVSSAEEFPRRTPLRLRIFLGEHGGPSTPEEGLGSVEIKDAIAEHFAYAADLKQKNLSRLFKNAQLFFAIGIVVLIVCLLAAEIGDWFSSVRAKTLWREGFVIIGWVSLWRPVELMLYEWWPLYEKIKLFQKLQHTEVEVRSP